jgi:Ca2+-binding RTX toxin-like protein
MEPLYSAASGRTRPDPASRQRSALSTLRRRWLRFERCVGAGDDVVYGGKGLAEIDGGDDTDKLYGQSGDDTVIGGAGIDRLVGGAGDDSLIATDDILGDTLFGGNTDGLDNGNDRAQIDHPNGVLRDFVFAVDVTSDRLN